MEGKSNIINIPKGVIFINNKIYSLFDKNIKHIPINSIIYNNNIYKI